MNSLKTVNRLTILIGLMYLLNSFYPMTNKITEYQIKGFEELDPNKDHIKINLMKITPEIKFYTNKSLSSEIALHINNKGVFYEGKLLCSWKDGDFLSGEETLKRASKNNESWMGGDRLVNCPNDLPIFINYSEPHGAIVFLFIKVTQRFNNIVEVSFKGKSYYMSLDSLILEWEYLESKQKVDGKEGEKVKVLIKDNKFRNFISKARNFIKGNKIQKFFTEIVLPGAYFSKIGINITSKQFTNWVLTEKDLWTKKTVWEEIEECFDMKDYPNITIFNSINGEVVYLIGSKYRCDLINRDGRWFLKTILPLP